MKSCGNWSRSATLASDVASTLKNLPSGNDDFQLNMFAMDDPRLLKLKEVLEKVNINTLTPVEALMKFKEIVMK
jgi:DNA mismatch repair protein MutS